MKGSVSLQFNWIFVILVGMALLGILFMQTQQATQKAKYEADLTLRESIQGLLASPSPTNYKEIKLGAVSVINDCDENSANLYIGTGRVPIDTNYYALHAPKRINSRTLHMQTLDGITLMTGDDHTYYFVETYDEILDVFNKFKGKKKLIDSDQADLYPLDDASGSFTMVYYYPNFNPNDPIAYNNVNYDFDIVVISPSEGRSVVYFIQVINNFARISEPEDYFNDGELLGAIVDSNYELYDCLHDKQLEKELLRTQLLQRKKDLLTAQTSDACTNLLNHADTYFDHAIDALNEENENDYVEAMKDLDELNLDLLRNNCPIIQ